MIPRIIQLSLLFFLFFFAGSYTTSAQSSSEKLYQQAVTKMQSENWKAALIDLNNCIKQNPDFVNAWISKGVIHLQLKEYDSALDMFGKVLTLHAGHPLALYNRALVKSLQGDYTGSMKDLNMALDKRPDHAAGYYNRALLHLHFQDTIKALIEIANCLKYDPDFLQAYLLQASLHAHRGNTDEAYLAFDRALTIDSSAIQARFNRAHFAYRYGQYQQALTDFQYLHSLFPEHPLIRIHLGGVLCMLNQKQKACELWQGSTQDLNAQALFLRYCKP